MESVVPLWRELLQLEINAGRTVKSIADKVGVARTTLSAIINRSPTSPYVTGTASTAGIEKAVLQALGTVVCPYRQGLADAMVDVDGVATGDGRITREQCRSDALRDAPLGNLTQMQHWRMCQQCEHKPAPIKVKAVVLRGPKRKVEQVKDESQQELEI